ncbi:hypothetical protein LAX5112_02572 [Roseibium alexandrii]|uniref:Uncharacterized protein n=1 Tax=Roseibium alexandrii TaxID=388408 RepID=A0A0M7A7T3_9HYPH|nr:hypothetical protein LAX5112_02572 [Roseibium alexandrii]
MAKIASRDRKLLTNEIGTVLAVTARIQMKMSFMVGIGIRPQYGCKALASGCMDCPQKLARSRLRFRPVFHDRNDIPICEPETGYVDRLAKCVLGKLPIREIVAAPALISRSCQEPGDVHAQLIAGSRKNILPDPIRHHPCKLACDHDRSWKGDFISAFQADFGHGDNIFKSAAVVRLDRHALNKCHTRQVADLFSHPLDHWVCGLAWFCVRLFPRQVDTFKKSVLSAWCERLWRGGWRRNFLTKGR